MNRSITNAIRYVMDEWLPPAIRDNKYFMYPFYLAAFGDRKNIKQYMDFKSKAHHLSEKELSAIYNNQEHTIGSKRPTDMNKKSIEVAFRAILPLSKDLLDVGCGRGYWLNYLAKKTKLELTGCDFLRRVKLDKAKYVQANIEKLPFRDKSFDVVFCSHTIEHTLNPLLAVKELKRVARKQVMIVVPKQRYYYHTLDLHLNFFPTEDSLSGLVGLKNYQCINANGDWVYIGTV